MGNYTKQHYVPACYLANFGIDGNKGRKSRIYFYNIKNNIYNISTVNALPVENNFYDIDNCENKKAIENFFDELEGMLAEILRQLFAKIVIDVNKRFNNHIVLSNEERQNLSFQIAMMIIRTRRFRDFYKDMYNQIKKGLPFANIPEYSEKDFQRLHTNEIIDYDMANFYSNLLDDRKCVVLINHTDIPFITSDNPVILIDHRKNKDRFPIAEVSNQATRFFPLSPKIALQFFSKNIIKSDMRYFDIYNKDVIAFYDNEIAENISRFLFSNVDIKKLGYRKKEDIL